LFWKNRKEKKNLIMLKEKRVFKKQSIDQKSVGKKSRMGEKKGVEVNQQREEPTNKKKALYLDRTCTADHAPSRNNSEETPARKNEREVTPSHRGKLWT